MKNIILFVSVSLILQACSHAGHLSKTAVIIAHDYTDSNRIVPDANSVLDLYNYNSKVLCYAGYFKQTSISDFINNQEVDFSIPNEDEGEKENLLDDPLFRKKEVLAFRDSVFHSVKQTSVIGSCEKPESRIYETICNELHALVKIDADRKFLIVSSDLCENSEVVGSYKKSFLRIITTDREKAKEALIKKFEDVCELPDDLKGISIYVLYKPDTKQNDIRFTFFREVYRDLFEPRGAKLFIKSINVIKQYSNE